ncbi:MAG TPA: RGCVC family protein [Jatrophihabitantaceae bacterium]|jgi:hypothetical protein|nr:RGCVC family protein [Jatrophihabitantaceae bacterium]
MNPAPTDLATATISLEKASSSSSLVAADSVLTCDCCPHHVDAHDATALRYCAATLKNATRRGCICRPNSSPPPN